MVESDREKMGVPPSGSGLRPFGAEPQDASQAEPLVPNADDEFADKSLAQITEFMAATAALIEICAAKVTQQQDRCRQEREFLTELTELYERLSRFVSGMAKAALDAASEDRPRRDERGCESDGEAGGSNLPTEQSETTGA